jgi:iron uptake system component EfeO
MFSSPKGRLLAVGGALLLAVGLLPACGGDDEGGGGGDGTGGDGGSVTVGLQEFAVSADPSSVPAGSVTFDVTNDGPDDVHEFVVVKTDLAPTDLPTDEDGAVLKDGEGMEVIDEIEDIPIGESQTLTVDLEAGSYALICNILQEEPDGTLEAHYVEGMRTGFTVE